MSLSIISTCSAIISAIIISIDLIRRPQSMRIMNVVWILTTLWSSIFGLIAYFWFGSENVDMKEMGDMDGMNMSHPMWQSVTLSTLHCGAGCTLADIIGAHLLFIIPISIGGSTVIGGWIFCYLLALIFGVAFQYSAIKSDGHMSSSEIITKALRADILSLTAWQIGMSLWLYVVNGTIDMHAEDLLSFDFWFKMQQAMVVGFILSLPINYLLIKIGIKSRM